MRFFYILSFESDAGHVGHVALHLPTGRIYSRMSSVRFVWRVLVKGVRSMLFRCGASACGERLLSFARQEDLECLLRHYAPAHTVLVVGYE